MSADLLGTYKLQTSLSCYPLCVRMLLVLSPSIYAIAIYMRLCAYPRYAIASSFRKQGTQVLRYSGIHVT